MFSKQAIIWLDWSSPQPEGTRFLKAMYIKYALAEGHFSSLFPIVQVYQM